MIRLDDSTKVNVNGDFNSVDQIELYDDHAHVLLNGSHKWLVRLAKQILESAALKEEPCP
jgi:hypothetical protein